MMLGEIAVAISWKNTARLPEAVADVRRGEIGEGEDLTGLNRLEPRSHQ